MAERNADPLTTVWGALEQRDCEPHGPIHQFRARCPGHQGDGAESLSVGQGADGRALLWCHVGCDAHDIVRAVGLLWSDLFPAGHRHARRNPRHAKARSGVDLTLTALQALGITYRASKDPHLWVAAVCPVCGAADRWPLWIFEQDRKVGVTCMNGCEQHAVFARLGQVEKAVA